MSENQKHPAMKRALCATLVATQLTAAWFALAQTNISSAAKQQQSAIRVDISPPQAVTAAGQWRVDGGTWQNSGAVVVGLTAGLHGLSFKPTAGWTAPTNRFVQLIAGQTNLSTGLYESNSTVVHLTGGGGTNISVAGAGSTARKPSPPGNLRVVAGP